MLGLATRAYRRLGILPAGGTPSDDQFEQALICYNSMATGQQADGPSLFRLTQVSLSIPTGSAMREIPSSSPRRSSTSSMAAGW